MCFIWRMHLFSIWHSIENLEMWARQDPLCRAHQNNRHSCGVDWVFVWLLTLRGAEEIVVFEVFISLLQINCLGKFADRILWFGGHLKTKTCLQQLTWYTRFRFRRGGLVFWSGSSSSRMHWTARMQRGRRLWRPRQSSWIGSGSSCTTAPAGWAAGAGACSIWRGPGAGRGRGTAPSALRALPPPEVKSFCFHISTVNF